MGNEQTAVPVQPGERIASLDILRAAALFGILVVNMPSYDATWWSTQTPEALWPQWYNRSALWLVDCFFTGKFNSLFSFLFGIGFTIQLERLEARSKHPAGLYLRRTLGLLLFGAVHAIFIWPGDVLHMYALLGALLLLLRRMSNKAVLALIVVGLLMPSLLTAKKVLAHNPQVEAQERTVFTRMKNMTEQAYGQGTYPQAVRTRMVELREIYRDPDLYAFYCTMGATMLLGLYAGRRGYLQKAAQDLTFVVRTQLWTGLAGGACALVYSLLHPRITLLKPSMLDVAVSTAYSWQRPALMLFYATTLVRLAHSTRWSRFLAPLQYIGRMPLTNYLAQSLICTLVFYKYGLGFYNRCGPALGVALSLVIFPAQVIASRWWLERYRFGPMEWAWRMLTYGKPPPMRLAPTVQRRHQPA